MVVVQSIDKQLVTLHDLAHPSILQYCTHTSYLQKSGMTELVM